MDDRNAARQIAAIFGRSCREPGNDPGLAPTLDSAAEVVARIRAEARAEAFREAVSMARACKWPEDGTGRHDLFNRGVDVACSAVLAYEPTHGDKDYPEDALYENGNYECICFTCGSHFIGHKGRVLCKACDAILADEPKERDGRDGGLRWHCKHCASEFNDSFMEYYCDDDAGEGDYVGECPVCGSRNLITVCSKLKEAER